jgi:hypothetical protein
MNHSIATHQSHLSAPPPPDQPSQANPVPASEPSSFRLSRASWGGDAPPPELVESSQAPDDIEEGED